MNRIRVPKWAVPVTRACGLVAVGIVAVFLANFPQITREYGRRPTLYPWILLAQPLAVAIGMVLLAFIRPRRDRSMAILTVMSASTVTVVGLLAWIWFANTHLSG
jgi:cytochrome bd-type quinol oxidase subunit 2